MFKHRFVAILIILISLLLLVPAAFAEDNQTVLDVSCSDSDILADDYYFDVSLENDTGDGTQSNPYKNLTYDRLVNNSVIHLSNGEYDFDASAVIDNVTIIGESANQTIIQNAYFTVKTSFTLYNLTLISSQITNNGNFSSSNCVIPNLENEANAVCMNSDIDNVNNYAALTSSYCNFNRISNNENFLSENDIFNASYISNNENMTCVNGTFTKGSLYNYNNFTYSGCIFNSLSMSYNRYAYIKNCVFNKSRLTNLYDVYAINSIFANASTSSYGGLIYSTGSDVNINLINCTFDNNHAKYGGAIYMSGGKLTVENSTFSNNYASLFGGAITFENNVNSTIKNTEFINDYSLSDAGGAFYIINSQLICDNVTLINCSSQIGGAITSLNSTLTLNNSKAMNNRATYYGGAVYAMYNLLSLYNSVFDSNSACDGGALYADDISTFKIYSNNFTNNIAEATGGAVYAILSFADYDSVSDDGLNNHFSNNSAFFENDVYESDMINLTIGDGNYALIKFNALYNGTLPSSFDLRDYGYVTSVKSQGSGGNCWSFSSIAALESCILKATGISYDLSEENMKNLMALFSDYGWAMQTNKGGYDSMGVGYLTSWLGPVNDSDDEYDGKSTLSAVLHSFIHVQNILFLTRTNYTDNDGIKKAIMDYGAVSTSIYWSSSYASGKNYYYSGTNGANHAVTIVGWDDNYNASNFKTSPEGNGAWIIKNSHGTSSGDKGFYYVSYYDTRLAPLNKSKAIYTIVFNDTINYDKNYQYDISGMTDYFLNTTSSVWYKNSFTATEEEYLAAVSTYFQKDTSWDLAVYVNDVLKVTKNGTATSSYKTIDLGEMIHLNAGDVFEVVFKITVDGDAGVPISEALSLNKEIYTQNISFISYDGVNWVDFYNLSGIYPGHTYYSQVACIKAFTVLNRINTTLTLSISDNINPAEITATVSDQYGNPLSSGCVVFTIENNDFTVSVENGAAKLFYAFENHSVFTVHAAFSGEGYNNASSSIKIYNMTQITLSADDAECYYGNTVNFTARLLDVDGNPVSSKEIKFTINNTEYISTTDSNGIAWINLSLDIGVYPITIKLNELSNTTNQLNQTVTVKSTINLPASVKYAYNSVYSATLLDSEGNLLKNQNVTFIISGSEYDLKTDSNGVLKYTITSSPATYTVSIVSSNGEVKSQSIKVVKRITGNSALKMYYGAGKYYKIRVCNDNGGYEKGLAVTFKINGKTYTRYTNANGYASFKITLNPKTYTIKATYKGYTVSNKIVVKKTIITKNISVKKGNTISFKAKLLNSKGKILKNKKVKFKFKGKTYSAKTNKKGIATLKITKKYSAGSYKIITYYGSAKVSNTIKIKK